MIFGVTTLAYAVLRPDDLGKCVRWYLQVPQLLFGWVVLLLIPGSFVWMTRATGRLMADIHADGVVKGSEEDLRQAVVVGDRCLANHVRDARWTYAAVAMTTVAMGLASLTGSLYVWDKTPYIRNGIWLAYAVGSPGALLLLYMVCIIVAREVAIIRCLNRFLREPESGAGAAKVRLQPWHPDRCGGLGKLNDFAIRFSYFIALCGFGLLLLLWQSIDTQGLAAPFRSEPILWLAIVVYVVLAPSVFFLTLNPAHQAMLREKTASLRMISDQLNEEYQAISSNLTGDGAMLASAMDRAKRLNELHELTARFPVWPFDLASLRRFAAAVLSPFAGVSLSVGIKVVVNLFGRGPLPGMQ